MNGNFRQAKNRTHCYFQGCGFSRCSDPAEEGGNACIPRNAPILVGAVALAANPLDGAAAVLISLELVIC